MGDMLADVWRLLRAVGKPFGIALTGVWGICIVISLCLGGFGWPVVSGLLFGGLLAAGYLFLLALAVNGTAKREPGAARRYGGLHYLLRYGLLAIGLYAAFTSGAVNPYCVSACLLVPKLACYGEAARLGKTGTNTGRRANE